MVGKVEDGLTRTLAYVVLKSGHSGDDALAGALKAFVKDQLAPHKYPREIRFIGELPKTATGKIQRFKLREAARAMTRAALRVVACRRTGALRHRIRMDQAARATRRSSCSCTRGSGSLAMWKDFPRGLCEALGARGLVFSRPGYGRSTPRAAASAWPVDFMHRQAQRRAAGAARRARHRRARRGCSVTATAARSRSCTRPRFPIASPASIASRRTFSSRTSACAASRRRAGRTRRPTCVRGSRATTPIPIRRSGAGTTSGSIRPFAPGTSRIELAAIRCPVLAVQGEDDEYGTMAQIDGIARAGAAGDAREARCVRSFAAPRPAGAADGGGRCLPRDAAPVSSHCAGRIAPPRGSP